VKIFFAGTPLFAVPVLSAVASEMKVCGVLTAPDKPQGRGKRLIPSPVKEEAVRLGLDIFQPEKLDEEFIEKVRNLSPDILVVAAYGKIFKESFLSIFPNGGINIHPSLLPQYRGPAPIPAMILAGDTIGGITIQRLALRMDAGDILEQKSFELTGTETTAFLTEFCSKIGAEMVIDVLAKMENGSIESRPQAENCATFCKFVKKEHGLIDWNESAAAIERKIRAYIPWPRAFTSYKGQKLAITEACICTTEVDAIKPVGSVMGVDKECGILVKTGNGILGLKRVQLETKSEADYKSFQNGHQDILTSTLGDDHA
jgi:methionyl-tRNA formyltransferase